MATSCLLHNRLDLIDSAVELLNNEWKMSYSARTNSIRESSSDLPCSLLLVLENKVIGHARISGVLAKPEAIFVESVTVAKKLRGQGYGRIVMEECENFAGSVGRTAVHLSTHDKESFYRHLGYVSGPVVSPLDKCSKLLTSEQLKALAVSVGKSGTEAFVEEEKGNSSENPSPSLDYSSLPTHPAPPPPPPPPPPVPKRNFRIETKKTVWLVKLIDL
eukprot:m.117736 g.117736  ORF g.117736 m.117736 type:complete len:218 (+) comp37627_c0_seq5:203-856(+)